MPENPYEPPKGLSPRMVLVVFGSTFSLVFAALAAYSLLDAPRSTFVWINIGGGIFVLSLIWLAAFRSRT